MARLTRIRAPSVEDYRALDADTHAEWSKACQALEDKTGLPVRYRFDLDAQSAGRTRMNLESARNELLKRNLDPGVIWAHPKAWEAFLEGHAEFPAASYTIRFSEALPEDRGFMCASPYQSALESLQEG